MRVAPAAPCDLRLVRVAPHGFEVLGRCEMQQPDANESEATCDSQGIARKALFTLLSGDTLLGSQRRNQGSERIQTRPATDDKVVLLAVFNKPK